MDEFKSYAIKLWNASDPIFDAGIISAYVYFIASGFGLKTASRILSHIKTKDLKNLLFDDKNYYFKIYYFVTVCETHRKSDTLAN